MGTADPRGFTYALEPERRRRQWQLDAAMARLGGLRRQMAQWESTRDKLQAECAAQAAQVGQVWAHRVDPGAHARLLRYVAALQQRRADADKEIASLAEQLTMARLACSARQQKLEALDRHRAEAQKAHATESHRKEAALADQDWTARDSHRSFGRIAT
ncbi:MAG: hypothetical protein EOO24_40820 [Comamonadaceae bacterium]|nr:MAG: hypothetical protein EOO24_40820 [Comamonadaceae bacterium]